jgi:hypothetical protein
MNRLPLLAGFGLAALLGACASPLAPTLVVDRAACDSSLALTPPLPLNFDLHDAKNTDVQLDKQSHCIEVDGARDYYSVFDLPRADQPYTISVGAIPEGKSVPSLQIVLLDAQGAVARRVTVSQFQFRGDRFTALFKSRPNETRMVVQSDHALVGQELSRIEERTRTNVFTGVAGKLVFAGSFHTGEDETVTNIFSYTGRLVVTIMPAASAG